jgi:predicted MPP superfamily phosphohydrolase
MNGAQRRADMKRPLSLLTIILAFLLTGFIGNGFSQNGTSATKEVSRLSLPMKDGSVRFVVIGDTGSGTDKQRQLAEILIRYKEKFPFEFVLLLGDNLYGGEKAKDYDKKFESVYKELLDAKVKFYASLGNHDTANQRLYEHFNMNGKEYYSFKKGKVAFWALNSNYMDQHQIKWLEEDLSKHNADWKISFFHHPLYSSGKAHGPDEGLRKVLEPILLKHGVSIVFAGHEHFYERIKPQQGIYHFISGAGGKLRAGDVKVSRITEKSYDQDLHFMLIEITDDELHFQVISRTGKTVDSGIIMNPRKKNVVSAN